MDLRGKHPQKEVQTIIFARHQALTKTISNLMRLREHSYNFPIAHDSERGWVVVRLYENERLHSILHACEKDMMVVELNVDFTFCQL